MERKTALVTGAAKGIGAAIVRKLADNGYSVIINYRSSEKEAFELVSELQKREINCAAFKADLSDAEQAEELYMQCKKCFGFVDTVINNAGVCHFGLATEDGEDDYRFVIDNNFGSVFNVCRLFARDMINEWRGSIINVSSVWGERGASNESLYSASKSAVIGYTKALAKELSPERIKVNCILPGFVMTDMNAKFDETEIKSILRKMRQKEILYPSDIADAVYKTLNETYTGRSISVMKKVAL